MKHRVWNPERETMYYLSTKRLEGEEMLSSGALDKNGNLIYEGDIVLWPLGSEKQFVAEYNRDYGKWNFLPKLSEEMEIIGNIYE